MDVIERIKNVLEQIRPKMQQDGGELEFVKFEEGIVYIELLGNCAGCEHKQSTIANVISKIVSENVAEVKEVKHI